MPTEQQEKARFFGMHIGHQVYLPKYEEELALLRGVSLPSQSGTDVFNAHCIAKKLRAFIAPLQFCKLILKPLSQISDEDAIECACIGHGHKINLVAHQVEFHKGLVYVLSGYGKFEINWQGISEEVITCLYLSGKKVGHNSLWACEYLRSKGYCLPYMGKDPYKEGWAVRV